MVHIVKCGTYDDDVVYDDVIYIESRVAYNVTCGT